MRNGEKSGYLRFNPRALAALNELIQGIQSRRGLLVMTGEIGTGKTALVRQLREWLNHQSIHTAFIFNPLLDTNQFFDYMLSEFGVRATPGENSFRLFSDWLYGLYRLGKSAVLIVDEAQGLSPAVLQALVPLLNLEMGQDKLLQIVLVGQLDLNEKLKRPELRPLLQRVAVRTNTAALSYSEMQSYIETRRLAADSTAETDFTLEALHSIYVYSRGIIRVINLLCDHALADGGRPVEASTVEQVARKFDLDEAKPVSPAATPIHFSPAPAPKSEAIRSAPVAANSTTIAALRNELILGARPEPTQNESSRFHEITFIAPGPRPQPISSVPAPTLAAKHPVPTDRVLKHWVAAPAWRAWIPRWYRQLPLHVSRVHHHERASGSHHKSAHPTTEHEEPSAPPPAWRAWIPRRYRKVPINSEEVLGRERSSHNHRDLADPHRPFDYKNLLGEVSETAKYATSEIFRWLREPMYPARVRRAGTR